MHSDFPSVYTNLSPFTKISLGYLPIHVEVMSESIFLKGRLDTGKGWGGPCPLLSYWWTSSARLQKFHKPNETRTNLLSCVGDGLLSWILDNYQRDLGRVLCIRFSLNKTHLDIKYFSGEILYAGSTWKHVQAKRPKHPGPKLETNSAQD